MNRENEHHSHPPVIKDSENQQPIAGIWRGSLRKIVQAFVVGDYSLSQGIEGVEPLDRASAEQIKDYITDYGATLIDLPDDTWKTSVSLWYENHWELLIDLWTAEEGRSDMVLHCWVREVDDGYRIKICLVYVP